MYLYLIMCLICRFIVSTKSTIQYSSRMGQNTGTSKIEKNVKEKATTNAFVSAYLHEKSAHIRRGQTDLNCLSTQNGPKSRKW
jgi:hypothetical protein